MGYKSPEGGGAGLTEPVEVEPSPGSTWQVDVTDEPARDLGKVDIASLDQYTPESGRLPVVLPASTLRLGGTYDVGGQIIDETGTVRTINRAFSDPAGAGDNSIVATQGPGVRIRVLAVKLTASAAVSSRWRSATTSIDGLDAHAANGGYILGFNPHGWFQTTANEALNLNLSAAVAVAVTVIWVQAT